MSGQVIVDGYGEPGGGRHGPRRPARHPRRRLGAVRHLAQGRRHRGPRLGRAHERVHGPEGLPGGVRRRRRGAGRLALRGAPLRPRDGRRARRRLRGEGDARRAPRPAARRCWPRPRSTPTRRSSAATARRASSTTSTSTTSGSTDERDDQRSRTRPLAPRPARVGHLRPRHDRRHPARRPRGHLRHPRLRRQAPRPALRRPAVPRRQRVALSAGGLPRALRHRRDDRHAVRLGADPARHPDHDRGDELRRAVGPGQGGAGPRRQRGRHVAPPPATAA